MNDRTSTAILIAHKNTLTIQWLRTM